jgi:hypothetical protein
LTSGDTAVWHGDDSPRDFLCLSLIRAANRDQLERLRAQRVHHGRYIAEGETPERGPCDTSHRALTIARLTD